MSENGDRAFMVRFIRIVMQPLVQNGRSCQSLESQQDG